MERKRQRLAIRRAGMAAVLLVDLGSAADAQTSSLAGSVVDRYGVIVARAPVEARNSATGADQHFYYVILKPNGWETFLSPASSGS